MFLVNLAKLLQSAGACWYSIAMKYIKKFEDIRLTDVPTVGGKTASIGQMIADLSGKGVIVPTGFAITAQAYWYFLEQNNLVDELKKIMAGLTNVEDLHNLEKVGSAVRAAIEGGVMPKDLAQEIVQAYHELSVHYGVADCDVAVRSSATAEDLPGASFAGQQETYLNIHGNDALLKSCIQCMASLFTDRAIAYRVEHGFDHFKVALSIAVQKMIRSDLACSGVAFSVDTETGFKDVVMINASYGLGEMIVKGSVIPDEFLIHSPTLEKGFASIIKKQLGDKKNKMVYAGTDAPAVVGLIKKMMSNITGAMANREQAPVKIVSVSEAEQKVFCLNDQEVLQLARAVLAIDRHYTKLRGSWCPMDVEWAKDGIDGKIYIVQARPETVQAMRSTDSFVQYHLKASAPQALITGQSIGQKIVSGTARLIASAKDIDQVQKGDIIVTQMTDPDWVPAMKRAAGIITDRGGRTCHAAIVSRELGIPALVGTQTATTAIKDGQTITLDCSRGKTGYVYAGAIPFESTEVRFATIPKLPVDIMVNIADPETAFMVAQLPVAGVGLARLEFIISNEIKIHPMALVHPELVTDQAVVKEIDAITAGYASKKDFFIDRLAQGVGMIVAAFYPKKVIVRLSDFKSNEYRNLVGGIYFEPEEENPMIGLRGASRYYNERYREAFALECAALKKVRNEMGLVNMTIMVPFVRTVEEGRRVLAEMARHGLVRGDNGLEIIMMVEIPSNVLLIKEFSALFDGFSIGSNDLTQLTLGVDRDSQLLADIFDERDLAVKKMMALAVEGARASNRYIGICGQAPSDYPEIAEFLMELGISSISLNQDSVVSFLMRYAGKS